MIITKVIQVGVSVQNCIGMYADKDAYLMQILVDKYEGTCFNRCFILKITGIVKTSECVINKFGDPGFGTLSVQFEARAIILSRGEVINGCTIDKNTDNDKIICHGEHITAIVSSGPLFKSLARGQIISIRVNAVKYTIASNNITVDGSIYVPSTELIVFQPLDTAPTAELVAEALERLGAARENMERLRAEKPDAWKFFSGLLHGYKSGPAALPNSIPLDNVTALGKFIGRDPRANLTEPTAHVYDEIPEGATVYDADSTTVCLSLIEDYIMHLRNIEEMIRIYDGDRFGQHKNLWLIFQRHKV